jgi:hypothetical protein
MLLSSSQPAAPGSAQTNKREAGKARNEAGATVWWNGEAQGKLRNSIFTPFPASSMHATYPIHRLLHHALNSKRLFSFSASTDDSISFLNESPAFPLALSS